MELILCRNALKFGFQINFVRNLSSSPTFRYLYNQPKSNSNNSRFGHKSDGHISHPYDQLFPWKSLSEFSRHLADNVVYFDGKLLAISKPWGVGTYKSTVNVTEKNSHLSTALYSGSSKYCLSDSIQHLCQILGTKKLKIIKTLNRFMSGIVLFATNDETEKSCLKAIRRSQAMDMPSMSFWCLTKGWPTFDGNSLRERVGIRLLELDELGDHKQPIIIGSQQLTTHMRRKRLPMADGMVVKPVFIELKTIDTNKSLGVSLVELSTNVLKWNFIECYLAYKTSFVLGDTRFSQQVKHILGTPLSLKPDKINFSEDVEPVPSNILRKLKTSGNGYIPVHIHHKRIVLPLYLSKKDKKDLIIETNKTPDFFNWSLKQLDIKTND